MDNKILKLIVDNWKDIGIFITGLVGLFIGAKNGYKKAFIPIRDWIRKMDRAADEVNFNGGKSTKDMVKRIDDNVSNLRLEVTALSEKTEKIGIRQKSMIELSDAAMFECDKDGYCVTANIHLCELFDSTPNKMYGHGWLNYVKEPDKEREFWERATESDNEITRRYTIIPGIDKGNTKEIVCRYIATIKRDKNDQVINITGKVIKL